MGKKNGKKKSGSGTSDTRLQNIFMYQRKKNIPDSSQYPACYIH